MIPIIVVLVVVDLVLDLFTGRVVTPRYQEQELERLHQRAIRYVAGWSSGSEKPAAFPPPL